jgi:hypothetical protein
MHATLSTGKDLDLLARDLADNALLVLGLNFSDLTKSIGTICWNWQGMKDLCRLSARS